MAYVYYDDDSIPEGMDAADVVSREDYDAIITERDEIVSQRDEAIVRAETAEDGWAESREKYANRFLTTAARVKQEQEDNVKFDGKTPTVSFAELFNSKEDEGAY